MFLLTKSDKVKTESESTDEDPGDNGQEGKQAINIYWRERLCSYFGGKPSLFKTAKGSTLIQPDFPQIINLPFLKDQSLYQISVECPLLCWLG
jgi:hypothetical protein